MRLRPMTNALPMDVMIRLHRGEISPAEAFAGLGTGPSAYEAAAEWIRRSGDRELLDLLALHE